MDEIGHFFGRLHPLLVHVPIGFFLLFAALELGSLLSRQRRSRGLPGCSREQRTFVLGLLALCTFLTVLAGWLLAGEGGYEPNVLGSHRLLGFVFAGCTLLLLAVHQCRWPKVYHWLGAASFVVLIAAGHFGAVLTHGADYFSLPGSVPVTRTPPARSRPAPSDPAKMAVFADIISPMLQERCVGCHGPRKSNGKLRFDSWERLLAGGRSGPAVKRGDAANSALVRRLHLPLAEKEHMPPKGKPQLSDEEISLIEWWIDAGAPADKKLAELEVPAFVAEFLQDRFPAMAQKSPPIDRAAVMLAAAALAREHGIVVRPLTQDKPWLMVNARLRANQFGDANLVALAPIAPAIQWLDIGETAVTDAGLTQLSGMINLRRLHLDRTGLTDAGLAHVVTLKNLEYLNLYGTAVTDAGIGTLTPLKRLRALYLWQTKATPGAVKTLAEQVVDRKRLRRLDDDLSDLQRKIRAEEFRADFGALVAPPAPAPSAAPPAVPTPPEADDVIEPEPTKG